MVEVYREKDIQRERSTICWIQSPKDVKGQSWAYLKLEDWNFIQVSEIGAGEEELETSSASFLGTLTYYTTDLAPS